MTCASSPNGSKAAVLMDVPHSFHIVLRLLGQWRGCWVCSRVVNSVRLRFD